VGFDVVGLFGDLVRLETELWNRVEAQVEQAHGVPLAGLDVTQVVAATTDCRVLDIARALSITVGGASKVVDRLEAGGLCRRQPNPTDGRSSFISLTASGRSLLEAGNATLTRTLDGLIGSALPADELAELSVTLRRLRQHLSASRLATMG